MIQRVLRPQPQGLIGPTLLNLGIGEIRVGDNLLRASRPQVSQHVARGPAKRILAIFAGNQTEAKEAVFLPRQAGLNLRRDVVQDHVRRSFFADFDFEFVNFSGIGGGLVGGGVGEKLAIPAGRIFALGFLLGLS